MTQASIRRAAAFGLVAAGVARRTTRRGCRWRGRGGGCLCGAGRSGACAGCSRALRAGRRSLRAHLHALLLGLAPGGGCSQP